MSFNKKINIFLLAITLISCQQETVSSPQTDNEPQFSLNCNYIENNNEVTVTLNIQVVTKNKKLFNGSIKGQGLSKDYYKKIPDINSNTSFEAEYLFTTQNNGTYTFVVFFENSDGIYTEQCNGSVSSITTTTTVKKTTTTTVKTTTTTTTTTVVKKTTTTTVPEVVDVRVALNLDECHDRKQKSTLVVDNSLSTTDLFLAVSKWEGDWIDVYDGIIKAGEILKFDYSLQEVYNSGLTSESIIPFAWSYDYRTDSENWPGWKYTSDEYGDIAPCEVEYDKTKFQKLYFSNRGDNPFICELPEDLVYDFYRCITSEKWRMNPSIENESSNWVDFCGRANEYYPGGYCGEDGG